MHWYFPITGFDSIPEDEAVEEDDTAQISTNLSGRLSSVLSSAAGEALQSVPSLPKRESVSDIPHYDSSRSLPEDVSAMQTRIQELEDQVWFQISFGLLFSYVANQSFWGCLRAYCCIVNAYLSSFEESKGVL